MAIVGRYLDASGMLTMVILRKEAARLECTRQKDVRWVRGGGNQEQNGLLYVCEHDIKGMKNKVSAKDESIS